MHHTTIRPSDALALAVLRTLREEGLPDADVLGEASLAAMGLYDSLPRERGADIGRAVVQCHRFARRAEVARGRIVGDDWLPEGWDGVAPIPAVGTTITVPYAQDEAAEEDDDGNVEPVTLTVLARDLVGSRDPKVWRTTNRAPETMLTIYARTASGWDTTWEQEITGQDWDDFLARAM